MLAAVVAFVVTAAVGVVYIAFVSRAFVKAAEARTVQDEAEEER